VELIELVQLVKDRCEQRKRIGSQSNGQADEAKLGGVDSV